MNGDVGSCFEKLLGEVKAIVAAPLGRDDKLRLICKVLRRNIPYYNWVGFYLVDEAKGDELVLGPFEGEPTEHVRIPFGRGICGQAAQTRKTFLVEDVSKETNYLACSPKVKSEIVVPIIKDGKLIGELDIDSHRFSAFTEKDKIFLEKVCKLVSMLF